MNSLEDNQKENLKKLAGIIKGWCSDAQTIADGLADCKDFFPSRTMAIVGCLVRSKPSMVGWKIIRARHVLRHRINSSSSVLMLGSLRKFAPTTRMNLKVPTVDGGNSVIRRSPPLSPLSLLHTLRGEMV